MQRAVRFLVGRTFRNADRPAVTARPISGGAPGGISQRGGSQR